MLNISIFSVDLLCAQWKMVDSLYIRPDCIFYVHCLEMKVTLSPAVTYILIVTTIKRKKRSKFAKIIWDFAILFVSTCSSFCFGARNLFVVAVNRTGDEKKKQQDRAKENEIINEI